MTEPFGQALRQLRKDAGINLVQMSQRTGIARSHLYRLENGESSEPSAETLNAIAEVLEVDPEELYELAWQTTGTGPGLPSLPTYFRSKYRLEDAEIESIERALRRIQRKK